MNRCVSRCTSLRRPTFSILLVGAFLLYTCLWFYSIKTNDAVQRFDKATNSIVRGSKQFHDLTENCTEKSHIVYIKVPKTGSSTMTMTLVRFGLKRKLTFAIPKSTNMFGDEPLLPRFIDPIANGKHYDLLVQHSTYNYTTVRNVFPADTVIIVSLREPFEHFLSSFFYFDYYKIYRKQSQSATENVQAFLSNKFEELQSIPLEKRKGSPPYNYQTMKMGLPVQKSFDVDFVRQYITTELDKHVDFVLIQTYFDESLVLMRRFFCWEMADIVYLLLNSQNYTEPQFEPTDTILWLHQQISVAEYMLYSHFLSKYQMMLQQEGADFYDEVRAFKETNRHISSFCSRNISLTETLQISASPWGHSFQINRENCRVMAAEDYIILKLQKRKQLDEIRSQNQSTV